MPSHVSRSYSLAEEVEAVLLAAQALVAISAQSVAVVEDVVSLSQLRVLMVVFGRGPLSLTEMAQAADMHSSMASRACDRLARNGLLSRREDRRNRRQVTLELTPHGRRVVEAVLHRRRTAAEQILRRMPSRQRTELVPLLRTFAVAGGAPPSTDVWAIDRLT